MGIFDIFRKKPELTEQAKQKIRELDKKTKGIIREMEDFYHQNTPYFGHARVHDVLVRMQGEPDPDTKLSLLEEARKMVSDIVYSRTNKHYHESHRKMEFDQEIEPFMDNYKRLRAVYAKQAEVKHADLDSQSNR